MIATVIKSTLLGLTLGAALAYAAEPDQKRGTGSFPNPGDADRNGVEAAKRSTPAQSGTITLPLLPLATPPASPMATPSFPPAENPTGKTMR